MKIAHLILAHTNPNQLKRLIKRLTYSNVDFYIHIDLKVSIDDFSFIKGDDIFFVKERINVTWGGYSMVQATVNGFYEILQANKEYDYINLLSGQDYPLKKREEIYGFFEANPGKAFMEVLSIEEEWQEAITRLTKYHLTDYNFLGSYQVQKLLNFFLPKRKLPKGLIQVGRSQWFTITPTHVKYILKYLKENQSIQKFFKLTWGSDEIIFQTILYNSVYKDDIVKHNLMYIDWSEGKSSPKTFTIKDFPDLINSDKLFARKFNDKIDIEILNALDVLQDR